RTGSPPVWIAMEVAVPQGSTFPSADEELIRTDPRLPGLRSLLTGDAAAALLDTLLPESQERPSRITVVRGRYRRGTSFTATLVLHSADGPQYAFARAFPPDAAAELAAELDYARRWHPPAARSAGLRALAAPRLHGLCSSPDLGIVLGPPADDRALPALRWLVDEPHRSTGLAELSPRTRSYLAGHHWTGQTSDASGAPRLVLHARSAGVNAACYLGPALAGIPVPGLVKVSRYGLVVTEWLPGTPVNRLAASAQEEALAQAGRLLARLHAAPPPRELPRRDLDTALSCAAADLSALLPRLASRAAAVAQDVSATLARTETPSVFVHGRLAPTRIIVGEHGPAFVDLTEAHRGHPAVDLAWYAASCAAAQPRPGRPVIPPEPLLAGYLDALPPPLAAHVHRDLGAVTAAALLHQATVPFRRGAPDWGIRAAALLAAAEAALAEQ
ncbi:MAG: aminoglycoside phosphotransferase family protein, partial [Thermobifida fusca]|nr:aminoglycoside phosphotransferase family protein [Thermobifida fusca]